MLGILQQWEIYLSVISGVTVLTYLLCFKNYKESKKILVELKKDKDLNKISLIFSENDFESIGNEIFANIYDNNEPKIIKNFKEIITFEEMFKSFRFIDGLPQLSLTIGILGTFIGLSLGLSELGAIDFSNISNNTDELNKNISLLVSGIKLSFVSSIIGIVLSIIISGINTCIYTKCENSLSKICNSLNKKYYINSAEKEIASEIIDKLENVFTKKMSEMLEDNLEMQEELAKEIKDQNMIVQNSSKEFINKISSLSEIFKTSFKLSVKEIFDEDFISNIKEIQSRLEKRFEVSDITLERLDEKIKKTFIISENIFKESAKISESLEEIFDDVKESGLKILSETSNVIKQYENLSIRTSELYNPLIEKNGELLEKNSLLNININENIGENTKVINEINENIKSLNIQELIKVVQKLEDSIVEISESVLSLDKVGVNLGKAHLNLVERVENIQETIPTKEFKSISDNLLSGVSKAEKINDELGRLSNNFENIKIEETVIQVNRAKLEVEKLEKVVNKFTDDFNDNTEVIITDLDKVNKASIQIDTLYKKVNDFTDDFSDNAEVLINNFDKVDEKLKSTNQNIERTVISLEKSVDELEDGINDMNFLSKKIMPILESDKNAI